ncbi:hypothetical protein T459_07910 [Capsicum annuum]|uniref:Ubiquitin-like protease family profile domain-containing protein n=1 Tax=Capsicum annuum TaxID=4072 RepID=A0A2G2ZUZ4_CAPAN|nr:hypothetical protein T459_07910 [Capsicum annuum]
MDYSSLQQVGYMLQQINYLVQQIRDIFLLFSMVYSSVATDQLYVATDNIPGAIDLCNNHHKKIILDGGLVVVDDGSRSDSGSGAAVGVNETPLTIFETTSHYDYNHTGCTDFSPDFAISSKYSICKCQDCKAKYDGVINVINALTASIKEMTSKRGVILSKRISYPYTPLEIKVAKRRRKDTSKASSGIEKSKIAMPLSLSCTDAQCARATRVQHDPKKHIDVIFYYLRKKAKLQTQEQYRYTTDNCLYKVYINNAYDRYCQQQSKVFQNEECLINIIKGFSILAGLPWYLIDEVYIPINCGDEFHWVLAIVILKERCIRVYDSMSQRRCCGPSSEIQKLAKILPTYLDMNGFLDQKVRTDWSMIEAYRVKMGNPFDAQYVEGIAQQTICSL